MKSTRSFALTACLVASALPVAAQKDPLARALTREAVRLTTAGEPMTSVVEPAQQSEGFEELQGRLKPGDTIFVTDRQGRETRGKLQRLSSTSLVVVVNGDEREIQSAEIGRIEKPDPG